MFNPMSNVTVTHPIGWNTWYTYGWKVQLQVHVGHSVNLDLDWFHQEFKRSITCSQCSWYNGDEQEYTPVSLTFAVCLIPATFRYVRTQDVAGLLQAKCKAQDWILYSIYSSLKWGCGCIRGVQSSWLHINYCGHGLTSINSWILHYFESCWIKSWWIVPEKYSKNWLNV